MLTLESSLIVFKGCAQGETLPQMRLLLIISFRYALMLFSDINQYQITADVLQWSGKLVNEILRLAENMREQNSYGIVHELLFYKYKYLFVSAELLARGGEKDEGKILQLYEQSMQVWWKRHDLFKNHLQLRQMHPRSDEELVDPNSEAFETLYRIAVISCSISQDVSVYGLRNISRSLSFHQEVWGDTPDEQLPEQVLVMTGKTMTVKGDCHRQRQEFDQATESYKKARQVLHSLKLPHFVQQVKPLLMHIISMLETVSSPHSTRRGNFEKDDASVPMKRPARAVQLKENNKKRKSVYRRRKKVEL